MNPTKTTLYEIVWTAIRTAAKPVTTTEVAAQHHWSLPPEFDPEAFVQKLTLTQAKAMHVYLREVFA